MKVYVVRHDIGTPYEPYYVIEGVYLREEEAYKNCLNFTYDCQEFEVIE